MPAKIRNSRGRGQNKPGEQQRGPANRHDPPMPDGTRISATTRIVEGAAEGRNRCQEAEYCQRLRGGSFVGSRRERYSIETMSCRGRKKRSGKLKRGGGGGGWGGGVGGGG